MKSICVVGMDGTGKSTLVKKLHQWLGEKESVIQYMGMKNWETGLAKYYFTNLEEKKYFVVIGTCFSIVYELYRRVLKYRNSKKTIIFDRYIDERIISLHKARKPWKRFLLKCFFRFAFLFFHRPSIMIYLTCDARTSFDRKDDINSQEVKQSFLESKKDMDEFYLSKPGVFVFNTNDMKADEVFEEVRHIVIKKLLAEKNIFSS